MVVEIRTGRGPYRLVEAAPAAIDADAVVLTLALERADGIERVVFRCRIASELTGAAPMAELVARMQPWAEREFEMTREAALKSIRTERKLHEIAFDALNRGPF